MYFLLRFVPKNHLSYVVGRLAYARLHPVLSQRLIHWFINRYGVKVGEVAKELTEYNSLGEFFTRDLKEGSRPVGNGIVSPVDGTLTEFGEITSQRIQQVKDKTYSIDALLRDRSLASRYYGGYFLTFYLAPGDYHHIHSPVEGAITDAYHIEGKLWPVNEWSVSRIDGLFSTNERIITVIQSLEFGVVSVVKVGATNVGSICTAYDTMRANQRPALFRSHFGVTRKNYPEGISVKRGERIGTFRMGSTVVLLFEPGMFIPGEQCRKGPIVCGRQLT